MNEILKSVLSLSFSGSLLLLILLLGKPLYRHRTSRRWQYNIWLIVIARLLVPFAPPESPVGGLFEKISIVERAPEAAPDAVSAPQPEKARADTDSRARAAAAASPVAQGLAAKAGFLWLAVALILLIRKITVYQSFVRYLKAGREAVSDPVLLDRLAQTGAQAGVTRPVELYTNRLISSPLLLGFFRPCIVLPTADLPERDFQYAVLHELTHYKRRDMFYKWLVQLAVCLHWFNPLVYLMSREVGRACELACDEEVIRKLDAQKRRAYGDALLRAMGAGGNYKDSLASVTFYESKEMLKERLASIMKYRPKSKIAVAATLAASLAFATGATAIGAYAAKQTDPAPSAGPPAPAAQASPVQISSGALPGGLQALDLSLQIDNGGVEILPAPSNELSAAYDTAYYTVQMTNQNGKWEVSATGKVAMMGNTDFVKLYVPTVQRNLDVHVRNGDFEYDLPENCRDVINVDAANCGVRFSSQNQYADSAIDLHAADDDYLKYGMLLYPKYFTETAHGFSYQNGARANQIAVALTGYSTVEFVESDPAS